MSRFHSFAASAALGAALDVWENSYAIRGPGFVLTGAVEPRRLNAQRATGGYFATLRVQPALGRSFGSVEDMPGKDKVVVLSHGFWQKQFAGDAGAMNPRGVGNVAEDLAGRPVDDHHVRRSRDEHAAGRGIDGDVIRSAFTFDVELLDLERLR